MRAVLSTVVIMVSVSGACSGQDRAPGQAAPVDGPAGASAVTGGTPSAVGTGGDPAADPALASGGAPSESGLDAEVVEPAPAGDAGATSRDGGQAQQSADAATADAGSGAGAGAVLPPIQDPARPGPFGVDRIDRVDGLATHSLFVPDATASNGKNPVVIWTNGNGGSLGTLGYASFVEHVASHGFLVIADKASNGSREAEVDSQGAAIDWALAQNARAGGDFFERIDVDRIAVMGHSLGSLASFATASNEHVTTSIHFSGGITDNPVGFDPSWLQQMRRPAAFLCGGSDATAGPSCAKDFAMAPVPVFYGVLAGASHIGPFVSPRAGEYGRAGVAWLRWQLAGDDAFRSWFVGDDCVLCSAPWSAMQRDLP